MSNDEKFCKNRYTFNDEFCKNFIRSDDCCWTVDVVFHVFYCFLCVCTFFFIIQEPNCRFWIITMCGNSRVNGICLNRWLKNNWSKIACNLLLFLLSWIYLFGDKYVFGDFCVFCYFWYFWCGFCDFYLWIGWIDVTWCIVYFFSI